MNDVRQRNTACRAKNFLCAAGMYLFLIVVCIVIIYPILWIVFSSFNPSQSMFSSTLVPKEMNLDNYIWLFTNPDSNYLLWFKNSMKISLIVMEIFFRICLFSMT